MRLVKGVLIGGGALALVASLLNLVAPKAVRGAAPAVAVQVENATTAPALTLDISRSASQQVLLLCASGLGCVVPPNGSAYTVPAGRNLVVTSADFLVEAGSGGAGLMGISLNPTTAVAGWIVPDDGLTHQFVYPSGIVLPAGYAFTTSNVGVSTFVQAYLHGYLTPI